MSGEKTSPAEAFEALLAGKVNKSALAIIRSMESYRAQAREILAKEEPPPQDEPSQDG